MSLLDSKATLSKAAKELFLRWEEVKGVWTDAQADEFEKTYLALLEQDVRAALGAMDTMNNVLQTIRSTCA